MYRSISLRLLNLSFVSRLASPRPIAAPRPAPIAPLIAAPLAKFLVPVTPTRPNTGIAVNALVVPLPSAPPIVPYFAAPLIISESDFPCLSSLLARLLPRSIDNGFISKLSPISWLSRLILFFFLL